jgi:hypothetical protein
MKKIPLLGLALLLYVPLFAQIDMNDSTAQVIGYWDKNEKQTYFITHDKYKIRESDTTSSETIHYAVDVTIVDSSANSYEIDWYYRDFDIQTDNQLVRDLASISENITIRIRTDEMGALVEVVNWKEVREYIYKGTKLLKQETKNIPNMDKVIKQIEDMYSTKESIEQGAVREIQQFYSFHGAKYEWGENYSAQMQVSNLYGGEPFDVEVAVWLDELNPEDNNFVVRSQQTVDSEQLTKATYDYLVQMAETMKAPAPKRSDIPPLTNDTWLASRIHDTGWVIYSVETKEVAAEGITNVEETVIEIQ